MGEQAGKKWPLVAVTAVLTAAVAFPAGLWISTMPTATGEEAPDTEPAQRSRATAPTTKAAVRDVYSARIASDPYVIDEQRAVVEAMERNCRHLGEGCGEAAAARKYIDRQAAAQ